MKFVKCVNTGFANMSSVNTACSMSMQNKSVINGSNVSVNWPII